MAAVTFRRAARLARIAALGPGLWSGLGIYGLILALNFAGVWVSLRMIAWNKSFYDALERLDGAEALRQVGLFFGLVALSAATWLAADWLRKFLLIRWRERLTRRALDLWVGNRGYWLLRPGYAGNPVENPDQRVADDCRRYVELLLELTLELVSEVVALVSYLALLWSLAGFVLGFALLGADIQIPHYMFWLAPVYAVVASIFAHLMGRPLKSRYFGREKVEADFRHALVQLRERADAVAQSAGEHAESRRLAARFSAIVANWRQVMRQELILGLFTRPYMQTVLRVPTFFALPADFAGAVTLGGLMQLAAAFSNVVTTLSWFVFNYRDLAEFVAVCERLDGLFMQVQTPAPLAPGLQRIGRGLSGDGVLRTGGLRLATPCGRWLDPVPDIALRPGQVLLIRGASGRGKTTLLCALSGLWSWGEGRVERPAGRFLFLPGGAPVMAEDLARAASYPQPPQAHDPARLRAVLERVGLGRRLASGQGTGGLSMGERQRVGLARAVLNRPDWLILDEATAALDATAEADLLRWLRRELPETTILITAHRQPAGLVADQVLHLDQHEDRQGQETA